MRESFSFSMSLGISSTLIIEKSDTLAYALILKGYIVVREPCPSKGSRSFPIQNVVFRIDNKPNTGGLYLQIFKGKNFYKEVKPSFHGTFL